MIKYLTLSLLLLVGCAPMQLRAQATLNETPLTQTLYASPT